MNVTRKTRLGPCLAATLALCGVAIFSAAGGCEERTVGTTPDAGSDAAPPVYDAWVGPDGMACETYAIWNPEPWPIVSVELFDAVDTIPARGRSFRVRVRHAPLPPCYVPGRIFASGYYETDGTTEVALRSHVWVLDASDATDCPPVTGGLEWIVPVFIYYDDTNAAVMLRQVDGTGTLSDPIEVVYPLTLCPPGQDCGCTQSPGGYAAALEPCDYDCQCQPGLLCLPALSTDPASPRVCQGPCNTQHDCRLDEVCYIDPALPDPSGPTHYCEPAAAVTCTDNADCPVGHQCLTDDSEGTTRCVYGQGELDQCCSDADCAPGNYCTHSGFRNNCTSWCLGIFGNGCNHCDYGFWSMTLDC